MDGTETAIKEEIKGESSSLDYGCYLNHEFVDKWSVHCRVINRHVTLVVRPGVGALSGCCTRLFYCLEV